MKKIVILILAFATFNSVAQQRIFYEQIALDYFIKEIKKDDLKKTPVFAKTNNGRWSYNSPCILEHFAIQIQDTLKNPPLNGYLLPLDLSSSKNSIPVNHLEHKISVSPATQFNDIILVAILEYNSARFDRRSKKAKGFYISLDTQGNIIEWKECEYVFRKINHPKVKMGR